VTTRYVGLLRAVNVGGAILKMDTLREAVRSIGCDDVSTYIQSGNVICTCARTSPAKLARQIEERLAGDLGVNTIVLVRSHQELADLAANNPFIRHGMDPKKLHVTFLTNKPDAGAARALVVPDGWPEELVVAGRHVYLHYPEGYGRSKLTNAYLEKRLGVAATTRNWATVLKLRDLSAG
jgi:uncharacterized protein (DUF1697 family)